MFSAQAATAFADALHDRPNWFTVTHEQAARARRIITRDFWNSDTPFYQPAYKEIGFPFVAGRMTADTMAGVYQSAPYQSVIQTEAGYSKIFDFPTEAAPNSAANIFSPSNQLLAAAFRQFMLCDLHIYGPQELSWSFAVEISRLEKNDVQRGTGQPHVDGGPGLRLPSLTLNDLAVTKMARDFRQGKSSNILLGGGRGIPRIYSAVDNFPTEFRNGGQFNAHDVVHFTIEEHWSPEIPEPCTRVFLRAIATPV